MEDRDILLVMSEKLGRIDAGIEGMRSDHAEMRVMIAKNVDDIDSLKQDFAEVKGASRIAKWAVAVGLTIAGFFIGSNVAN